MECSEERDSEVKQWYSKKRFDEDDTRSPKKARLDGRAAAERLSSDGDEDPEQEAGGSPPPEGEELQDGVSQDDSLPSRFSMYTPVAQKLMAKMGFREGEGLGKNKQGRQEIVEPSDHRGRRGLGLKLRAFQAKMDIDWKTEQTDEDNPVEWFPKCMYVLPTAEELNVWDAEGERKINIDDETEFCNEEFLMNVLQCKSVFDELDAEEMRKARTRANAFETIRGAIFLNRAAMKMANMDAVFDFMFTKPKNEKGEELAPDQGKEPLYFGDVCAGPGGFSEYILWRRRWHAKGFGFTLRGANDFKLEDFFAAPSEMFEPFYGVGGVDGDGDVTKPENLREFQKFVSQGTDGRGLHFLMADGGFSVEGQENLQEVLSKQLLLCQCLTALSTLRIGGHFVCKTFDLFTPFSVGLVYLLWRCFKCICIYKPVTSRPANSERYLVCCHLHPGSIMVHDYLFHVNETLCRLKDTKNDVLQIVPSDHLATEQDFCQHIRNSNQSLAKMQVKALAKIHAFTLDPNLHEPHQAEIRRACLLRWDVPDQARLAPVFRDPLYSFLELVTEAEMKEMACQATLLEKDNLERMRVVLDFRCMVAGGTATFLLGLGRKQLYTWAGTLPMRWQKQDMLHCDLPRDTLLLTEAVPELRGEGRAQRKVNAVHVLDAVFLNGTDVRTDHFSQRMSMAEKFVRSISKRSCPDMNPIRVKEVFRLEEIDKIFRRLEKKVMKGGGGPRLAYTGQDSRHFLPSGLHFIKTTKEPWNMAFSKKCGRKYFFNHETKESTYTVPKESIASFSVCHAGQLFWSWNSKLSQEDILSFVHSHAPEDIKSHQ
uniref:cap-specific mRNA (nucleoside-2'-O-)-methyltransferase 1 isoform X2 n=1 Tax=Myxine glutinosa TaxID=7769 RepID=UPI0035900562